MPSDMPRLKGFRFPREIIAYAVWAYHRFALKYGGCGGSAFGTRRDRQPGDRQIVGEPLWPSLCDCIKRDRPAAADKWHLDEVVVPIGGVKYWLWRAIDATGDVLDILVQPRRNAKAARRFLKRLVTRFGTPRVVVTDKLRSYIKPIRDLAPDADHRAHKGLQQPHGGIAPTDPQTRKTHGPVQVPKAGPEISRCP